MGKTLIIGKLMKSFWNWAASIIIIAAAVIAFWPKISHSQELLGHYPEMLDDVGAKMYYVPISQHYVQVVAKFDDNVVVGHQLALKAILSIQYSCGTKYLWVQHVAYYSRADDKLPFYSIDVNYQSSSTGIGFERDLYQAVCKG
jgi:hypothetical protein